jgi:excisionase family DNA binding protein
MGKLYTMNELCKELRISRPTATKLLQENAIKGNKIGHCWRITQEEIDRLLGKE